MMSLTFDLFTQVSGSGPLGPLVWLEALEVLSVVPFDGSIKQQNYILQIP